MKTCGSFTSAQRIDRAPRALPFVSHRVVPSAARFLPQRQQQLATAVQTPLHPTMLITPAARRRQQQQQWALQLESDRYEWPAWRGERDSDGPL